MKIYFHYGYYSYHENYLYFGIDHDIFVFRISEYFRKIEIKYIQGILSYYIKLGYFKGNSQ